MKDKKKSKFSGGPQNSPKATAVLDEEDEILSDETEEAEDVASDEPTDQSFVVPSKNHVRSNGMSRDMCIRVLLSTIGHFKTVYGLERDIHYEFVRHKAVSPPLVRKFLADAIRVIETWDANLTFVAYGVDGVQIEIKKDLNPRVTGISIYSALIDKGKNRHALVLRMNERMFEKNTGG